MIGMSKISQNLTNISSNFTPNCQGFAKCVKTIWHNVKESLINNNHFETILICYSCLKCISDISLSHYVLPDSRSAALILTFYLTFSSGLPRSDIFVDIYRKMKITDLKKIVNGFWRSKIRRGEYISGMCQKLYCFILDRNSSDLYQLSRGYIV